MIVFQVVFPLPFCNRCCFRYHSVIVSVTDVRYNSRMCVTTHVSRLGDVCCNPHMYATTHVICHPQQVLLSYSSSYVCSIKLKSETIHIYVLLSNLYMKLKRPLDTIQSTLIWKTVSTNHVSVKYKIRLRPHYPKSTNSQYKHSS